MHYKGITEGLKDGSITILENGHLTNSLQKEMQRKVDGWEDTYNEYVQKGKRRAGKIYKEFLFEKLKHGRILTGTEEYCFNCDERMHVVLLDEKTLAYINTDDFWELTDKSYSLKSFKTKISKEHIKECASTNLIQARKLTSKIEVSTEELIFQNFFRNDEIYENMENQYGKPTINSLLGRDRLMQYLAKKNVGYGQMGNMNATIYSNDNEIIIGNEIEDGGLDKDSELRKVLKERKLKRRGRISLDVWRWMCADKSVLEAHGEEIDEDAVIVKVKPGKWEVEHYFDFCGRRDDIYSRLKLID